MEHGPRRRVVFSRALLALLVLGTMTACGGEQTKAATPLPAPSVSTTPVNTAVQVTGLPEGVDAEVTDTEAGVENGDNLDFVSPVFTVEPAGSLPQAVKVKVELDNAQPGTNPLIAVTRATADQPWTYQRGALSADARHVEFTTKSLGQLGILSMSLDGAVSGFGADVTSGLAAGVDPKVKRPSCGVPLVAREKGYTVASTKSKTLFWCFGLEKDKRIVRVTNRKLTPVQVAHPDISVLSAPTNVGAYASWVGVLGTTTTFLQPGATATFDAELEPVTALTLTADFDSTAQSLRLLQATTRALALRLTSFDTGKVNVPGTVKSLLAMPQCRKSLGRGSDALLAGCFGPGKLAKVFGSRATLVAPILAAPASPALLRTQAQTMVTAQAGEVQRIVVKRAAPDFTAFVGLWSGSGRSLVMTNQGQVTETLYSETGELVVTLVYQLEDPVTDPTVATAKATITKVKVGNRKLLKGRVPRVRDTGTLTLRKGVVKPPFLKTNYCDPANAKRGVCGK